MNGIMVRSSGPGQWPWDIGIQERSVNLESLYAASGIFAKLSLPVATGTAGRIFLPHVPERGSRLTAAQLSAV